MITGWLKPFPTQRPLTQEEVQAQLDPDARQGHVLPDARFSLIGLDEHSAEFVDRSFRMRGSSITLFALVCFLVIVATLLYVALGLAWPNYAQKKFGAGELLVAILPVVLVATAASTMIWRRTLRRELFTYTHYPVRFDRERGLVHVFRHNGPNGVLSVPWKDVHWFVGRGERQEYLLDVRGALLDRGQVQEMFSVGHYFDDGARESVQALWEFIRTYMAGGPAALTVAGVPPVIDLSVLPSWRNAWRWEMLRLGERFARMRYMLSMIYYPVMLVMTSWRWMVLNSCKAPVWPSSVLTSRAPVHPWAQPRWVGEMSDHVSRRSL